MMKKPLFLIVSLMFLSCEWPFNTTISDGEVFTLAITHNISRIADSAEVQLSWDPMSVENFSHFRVERQSVIDSDWVFVVDIENPLTVGYKDFIHDDADLTYRMGVMDSDGNVLWGDGSTLIPKTTSLSVPSEWLTPGMAFKSLLIDDGDSILVSAGTYSDTLSMVGKTVYVTSISETDTAILLSRVWINTGVLKGFTLINISATRQDGGGIYIAGNGQVRNCIIRDNYAGQFGGGVFLQEEGSMYNNILYNNMSGYGYMNLYIVGSSGKVVNNTFVLDGVSGGSNVAVSALKDGFTFLNNIIYGSRNFKVLSVDTSSVMIDYSRMNPVSISGDRIITADPQFISLESEFPDVHLQSTSPCINAGHPDLQYNNVDGTRNTMGAYGGPGAR